MKKNTNVLVVFTWVILVYLVSILLNDLSEFNLSQFENFQNWTKIADKKTNGFLSRKIIEWSYYIICAGLFFWKGYLIYGFSYFLPILKEVENGYYFSDKIIKYFKKIGDIFISYTIGVLILKVFLVVIEKSVFNLFNELKSEFTFLIPVGFAFYILAEIFKQAKDVKAENDLTI
ncbi:hypothetical protein APS56_10045 [Pseudalgibacter alginicilyticus]|uniref:DUF2975 domain-containing protein n=1 Tax=Pseudalgibacter alginicilyticus TaxID=1736674 RepID=A0A0N7HYJ6_9FLAO|nr:DUF2975 domain-containing protein [Pseudalgibacter alginicilyticus]ALJ05438.1 hypothetical protein APS56_10045 [Pseudalgibacter alginicilyticus]